MGIGTMSGIEQPSLEDQCEQYASSVRGVIGTKYLHFVGCFTEHPQQPDMLVIKNPMGGERPFEVWAERPIPLNDMEKQRAIAAYDVLRGQVLRNPSSSPEQSLRLLIATGRDKKTLYDEQVGGKASTVMIFNPDRGQYEVYRDGIYNEPALVKTGEAVDRDGDINVLRKRIKLPTIITEWSPAINQYKAFRTMENPIKAKHDQVATQWLRDNFHAYQEHARFSYPALAPYIRSNERELVIRNLKEAMLKLTRAGTPFYLRFIDGDFVLLAKPAPDNPTLAVQALHKNVGHELTAAAAPLPAGTPPEAAKLHDKDPLIDKKVLVGFLNETLGLENKTLVEDDIQDKSLDPNKAVEGYAGTTSFKLTKILAPGINIKLDEKNTKEDTLLKSSAQDLISRMKIMEPSCKIVLMRRFYGGSKFTYEFKIVVPKRALHGG